MKIFDKINTGQMAKSWQDRYNPELSFYGGREVAFSSAVQAQVSPNGSAGTGEMPSYSVLHNVFVANEYTGWMDECNAISQSCYIGDWSWLNKMTLKGKDVWKCLEASTINNYRNFPVGKGKHAIAVNRDGKIVAEGIVFKLAEDEALLTGGLTVAPGQMVKVEGFDVEAEVITEREYIFHVQGPNSKEVVERLVGEDIGDIGFGQFRTARYQDRPVRIYRGGMSGELGYELMGSSEDGSVIWQAVVEAGSQSGIRQLGYRSMMVNHLQAFFPTIWVDYIPAIFPPGAPMEALYRSPVDFGWGNRIDKGRDFPGKEALMAELASPTHKTVTLEWDDQACIEIFASLFDRENEAFEQLPLPVNTSEPGGSAPMGLPVFSADGTMVGFTTNRGYSCQFKKVISLAYLAIDCTGLGTEVYVLYGNEGKRQTKIKATVKETPYKQDVRR